MRWVLAALLSHWRRHPVELGMLLVGLAVATALWTGVQALNAEARASYARAAAAVGGNELAAVVAAGGERIAVADYVALRRAGWPVSPMLEGEIERESVRVRVIGIDPLTVPPVETFAIGDGSERFLDFVSPPWLGLAAAGTIAALAGAEDLPELVAAEAVPPGTLVVDIGAAEALLGTEGRISRMVLPPEAVRDLPGALAGRLRVVPPGESGDLERLTDSFHLNLTAFGFLSFVVGLFIVYSAAGLAFEQRKPVFRSLRACGVSAASLARALAVELIGFALVAGAAGVLAGYLIAATLLPDVAASLRGLYGAAVPGGLTLGVWWWVTGLGMSVVGALAAMGVSLWRAVRLPVLAPAQPEAWLGAQRRGLRWQAGGALALLAAALAALAVGRGLPAGFVVMGGVLLAAALALPPLLAGLLALGAWRARGPVAQWAWADGRQQLGGLSLALMALLLALAVNVGVGTMVNSFRQTFVGWLDQRLASELYVTAPDAGTAEAIVDWAEARPEVGAVLPIWNVDRRFRDWPTEIYGFRDHATYRDNWPLLAEQPGAWDRVARGEAALVSEQLARRFGIAVGERIALPSADGPWEVEVAGVYSDYGNPQGQVMVALDQLGARFDEVDRRAMALRVAPDDAGLVLGELRDRFGLDETQAVDQASLKDFSRRTFERTFAVTVALNTLTLAVAGIALFTSLLTLGSIRLVQVAPLWAAGVRRRRLAAIAMGQTLAMALATALVAVPLGLVLARILTDVINVRAFGWRLPVFLFPGQWAVLVALALATAALAALLPALRLARAQPADLLRGFGNER